MKRTLNWKQLLNKKVSILIDNTIKDNKKESYEGIAKEITGDINDDNGFIHLDLFKKEKLDHILIRRKFIISIWVYKQQP